MDDISRRKFLKVTGKTILTAGVLSSGVGLSTSTTPVKTVRPKPGLGPVTPKAHAYKSYLRGMKAIKPSAIKGLITKSTTGTSLARGAFENSLSNKKFGNVATSPQSTTIASKIAPNLESLPKGKVDTNDPKVWKKAHQRGEQINRLSRTIHATGRTVYAKELLNRRKLTKVLRIHKENVDKRKVKSKTVRGMGGGGKFIGDGVETPRNPTGMSLITRRSILM